MSQLTHAIEQSLTQRNIRMVSFDLFDTLVFRKVARPTRIFAEAFASVAEQLTAQMTPSEYEELRHYAERELKNKTEHREVTLEEIIGHLPMEREDQYLLLDAELATEARYGFLDETLKSLILKLHNTPGVQLAFISDMYLSAKQIRDCFFHDEPVLQAIPLYVSSEHKVNKASGGLFKRVAELADQPFESWLHVGDNTIADIKNASLFGIETVRVGPSLDGKRILDAERKLYSAQCDFNAVRYLASTHKPAEVMPGAFELSGFTWGPALLSFCDWVIDRSMASKACNVLCLMREGEVFAPLIEKRLEQRGLCGLRVIKLYVSRKSTFWPAVDTGDNEWFSGLMDIFIKRRGYTIANFYADFMLEKDDILQQFSALEFKNSDSVFYNGKNILSLLYQQAENSKQIVQQRIEAEKRRFEKYFYNEVDSPLSQCITVDLGNGGTIQSHLELALGERAKTNLLFYSTNRIYQRLGTLYESFIGAHNDKFNLRRMLWRSPECIESFLLGDVGTTLAYDEQSKPILGESTQENTSIVASFYAGIEAFFDCFNRYGFEKVNADQAVAMLARYVRLPTYSESIVYTQLYHQDNFGADKTYPVIAEPQIAEVKRLGTLQVIESLHEHEQWQIGRLHWPQGICSVIDENFLYRREGLLLNDNYLNILNLIELIEERGWQQFSLYGAGVFFEQFNELTAANGFVIERLIDRKADVNGPYLLKGVEVESLAQALNKGSRKIVVTSYAFKQEIVKNITSVARELGIAQQVQIISV
tara:strand:- start:22966 stop:25254 length:2289 start_codon:yes stop_codon:yes gene_type:complete